jgi:hypothetical protein
MKKRQTRFQRIVKHAFSLSLILLLSCEVDLPIRVTNETTNVSKTRKSSSVRESSGPVIIFKADDLGEMSTGWVTFMDTVEGQHIRVGIGVTSSIMTTSTTIDQVKTRMAQQYNNKPVFEFWNHGYDHKQLNSEFAKGFQTALADYDNDGVTDLSIKTDDEEWKIDYSSSNGFGTWDLTKPKYGNATAHPVPADYDGDGWVDLSVKTDGGAWLIDKASDGFGSWDQTLSQSGYLGTAVPADYDGDGKVDLSVKTDDGNWIIDYADPLHGHGPDPNPAPQFGNRDLELIGYGVATAHPVPADYDGDDKADLSVKTNEGYWFIDYADPLHGLGPDPNPAPQFGNWDVNLSGYGDVSAHPVPADYDGDGKTDLSVKTDEGYWLIDKASDGFGSWDAASSRTGYGNAEWVALPGNFDSDTGFEFSVMPPQELCNKPSDSKMWFIDYEKNGTLSLVYNVKGEFIDTDITYQSNHIQESQNFFSQNLSENHSFGAPFNATDATTNTVLNLHSEINVWLQFRPICDANGNSGGFDVTYDSNWKDPKNSSIGPNDNHIVLSLTNKHYDLTGTFSAQTLMDDYDAGDSGQPYILIQMHPNADDPNDPNDQWTEDTYTQLRILINFYKSKSLEFMTPFEYYSSLKK